MTTRWSSNIARRGRILGALVGALSFGAALHGCTDGCSSIDPAPCAPPTAEVSFEVTDYATGAVISSLAVVEIDGRVTQMDCACDCSRVQYSACAWLTATGHRQLSGTTKIQISAPGYFPQTLYPVLDTEFAECTMGCLYAYATSMVVKLRPRPSIDVPDAGTHDGSSDGGARDESSDGGARDESSDGGELDGFPDGGK
jgi:hypothetical protein